MTQKDRTESEKVGKSNPYHLLLLTKTDKDFRVCTLSVHRVTAIEAHIVTIGILLG